MYSKLDKSLVGKRVRVTDEFNGTDTVGVLSSKRVDWECPAKGEIVYVLKADNGSEFFITDDDVVTAL